MNTFDVLTFLFTEINSLVFSIPAKYNLPDRVWRGRNCPSGRFESDWFVAAPVGAGSSGSGVEVGREKLVPGCSILSRLLHPKMYYLLRAG